MQRCVCGRDARPVACHLCARLTPEEEMRAPHDFPQSDAQITVESVEWQCGRVCEEALACGRHVCAEVCCAGEEGAAGADHGATGASALARHVCPRTCGRKTACKRGHRCERRCHSGPCGPCSHWLHESLTCQCSLTSRPAPLKCAHASEPLDCPYPCRRPRPCGHEDGLASAHRCSPHPESCPPCKAQVRCLCACGGTSWTEAHVLKTSV
jgi:transcriptional repressor NF-X1